MANRRAPCSRTAGPLGPWTAASESPCYEVHLLSDTRAPEVMAWRCQPARSVDEVLGGANDARGPGCFLSRLGAARKAVRAAEGLLDQVLMRGRALRHDGGCPVSGHREDGPLCVGNTMS